MDKIVIKLIKFIVCLLLMCIVCACDKSGEGGNATIQGKIMLVQHPNDDYTLATDTVVAAKTDVFIVYGDNEMYDDDQETSQDGLYQFKYLKKGIYTIFAYSTLATGEKIAVSQTVEVKDKLTIVPTIYIHEGKAYGTSMVRGQVWATYEHNGSDRGSGWAYEHRVYIKKQNHPYHFDNVRVGEDGYFYFQQLLPGTYEIFTTTEDDNEVPSLVSQTITITEAGKIYTLEKIFYVNINV
ncbi:MAG: hypothetical protein J5701_01695 [Bacteroidales bacterium]|nr:hypothetical protein [Bacteroidales bacterium]